MSGGKIIITPSETSSLQTNKNVISKINTIIKNVPKNFDVIYLGRCFSKCYLDKKINERLNNLNVDEIGELTSAGSDNKVMMSEE